MNKNFRVYRWYDEPNFISVEIENLYLRDLINKTIKKAKTIENLSKITKLSKATIHNYKNNRGMTIKSLKAILDFLNIKYNRINHKIKKIGWNNTKLNIKLDSNEIAIILAASLADGHINKSHFMYKNKNLELINRVKESIRILFGNVKVVNRIARNGTNYILSSSFVKRNLERLGSPSGKKLFQNPSIPRIIKNGTKIQKKLFIQQFFDDEGWSEIENKKIACSQNIDTTKVLSKNFMDRLILGKKYYLGKIPNDLKSQIIKPNLLVDIKEILIKDFGINTNLILKKLTKYKRKNKKGYVSATWELNCIRKGDVKKFEKYINFFSSNKRKILGRLIKEKPIPKNITYKLLNLAIKFKKEKGYFKVRDIQDYIDLERGKIRKRLNVLVKQNILYNNGGKYFLKLNI